MSKNNKRLEFQNQRTKDKIMAFVSQNYKDPNDIVSLDDIGKHLKQNYAEFQR